jgi:hypothetical protein
MKRLLSGGCLTAAVFLSYAFPAMASRPSPMTDEVLTSSGGPTVVNCEVYSAEDFSFTASGTASGPYPGTFIENGTGSILAPSVSDFSASFTIYALDGSVEVTGTTALAPGASQSCRDTMGDTAVEVPATYQATIHTARATYTDQGTTTYAELFTNSSGSALYQKFSSALTRLKRNPKSRST